MTVIASEARCAREEASLMERYAHQETKASNTPFRPACPPTQERDCVFPSGSGGGCCSLFETSSEEKETQGERGRNKRQSTRPQTAFQASRFDWGSGSNTTQEIRASDWTSLVLQAAEDSCVRGPTQNQTCLQHYETLF